MPMGLDAVVPAWILEADVYRLRKALDDAGDDSERRKLEILLRGKKHRLATQRGQLL